MPCRRGRGVALTIRMFDHRQSPANPIRGWSRGDASLLSFPVELLGDADETAFAHPAEAELGRLFTDHGVRWAYEPSSFALSWTHDGRVAQSFTPDFYLPDLNLYVELTTMRQPLVTRKNRKVRLLRALYPSIAIKMLYRRDFERLQRSRSIATTGGPGSSVHSRDEIGRRIEAIAVEILRRDESAGTRPLLMICAPGARRFAEDVRRAIARLGGEADIDELAIEAPRAGVVAHVTRGARFSPPADLRGRRTILVTDVISTGLTMACTLDWLSRGGVVSAEVCTLIDRAEARLVPVPIDYAGFTATGELLVGYGLRLRETLRGLDYIAKLAA